MLVWDNARIHLVPPLKEFFESNAHWLTVFQLPTYAPDLNPQEGVWALVKRDIGNLAATDLGQLTRAVKCLLKQLQYRPDAVDKCLAGTGLSLATELSEATEEAVPPGGALNIQPIRPGIVALQ